jgi:hypothetical protein
MAAGSILPTLRARFRVKKKNTALFTDAQTPGIVVEPIGSDSSILPAVIDGFASVCVD